ncbi:MFS general substrate transporter [Epithele typhae]|uniref:MFS general substrate transporter n=1 Tax=Epithele typhae TaxID=378194 RepID=UPI00200887CC|nr:MFS general substrate transporter [Epithele typhae]KAH9946226.1 MFS general substrate transporter [Epithele typhae]
MGATTADSRSSLGAGPSYDDEARTRLFDDYDSLGGDSALENQRTPHAPKVTPVPKAELATLCAVRIVDPIAFTQIFPYVNEMMEHLHLTNDPSRIGFYSGIVESSFALAQVVSIYQWAKLSDSIGRRPVVLLGMFGIGLGTLFMGMSTSLFGVIFARCLGGFFSGNVAVVHSVLGEITDSTNQAIAFPIYGLCWPLGAIIGPLIGGLLSNPATKYARWFDNDLFRQYPYLLPCIAASAIAFAGTLFGFFYLKETLPSRHFKSKEDTPLDEYHGSGTFGAPVEPISMRYLLKIPLVRALCLSGAGLSFITTGFDVSFVLFCYTPLAQGGLSFDAQKIGYALSISGLVSILLQIAVMPFVLRRFDHAWTYNACMALWPFCFVLLPALNVLARAGAADLAAGTLTEHGRAVVWLAVSGVMVISRTAALAFSVSMILVKEAAPSPSSLGVTNGITQFAMCLSRSFSPAFASSLMAFSMGYDHILLKYLWVLIMSLIAFFCTTLSRRIAEGRRPHPPR